MKRKILKALVVSVFLFGAPKAYASVVVGPSQVNVGSNQTFDVIVSSNRPYSTIALKLFIPEGIADVIPNVKSGWKITIKNGASGSTTSPTEIDWTGGTVPKGERDVFEFGATLLPTTGTLDWRAYQTYSDDKVVSWDQAPNATDTPNEEKFFGPYSQTEVINSSMPLLPLGTSGQASSVVVDASALALIFSVLALYFAWQSRSRK